MKDRYKSAISNQYVIVCRFYNKDQSDLNTIISTNKKIIDGFRDLTQYGSNRKEAVERFVSKVSNKTVFCTEHFDEGNGEAYKFYLYPKENCPLCKWHCSRHSICVKGNSSTLCNEYEEKEHQCHEQCFMY